jgi:hypothetical protein
LHLPWLSRPTVRGPHQIFGLTFLLSAQVDGVVQRII